MFISYVWTGWFCLLFIAIFHWELGWSQNAAFGLLGIFLIFNFVYCADTQSVKKILMILSNVTFFIFLLLFL
jgi:hypothetical protein